MTLSIIIPAFNESKKVEKDINAAADFIENNTIQGEIFIVDDGSNDTTAEIAESTEISPHIPLKVIRYEPHRGKGYAVRTGIILSTGDYVSFVDSGLCIPYEYILTGLKLLESGECDIAHGTRRLNESIIIKKQPLTRRLISNLFRWIFIHLLKVSPELSDTQCGFKVYKGNIARILYEQCVTEGFLFDIEIILRAQKRGYQIKEFPVKWTPDYDSRLSPAKNIFSVLRELIAIKRMISHM